MFKHSSSTSAALVALLMAFSLTVQGFPVTRSRIVFEVGTNAGRMNIGQANLNQPEVPQQPAPQQTAPQKGPAPAAGPPVITATLKDSGWPAYNGTEPNPPPASVGDTVTYTTVITNTGASDATGVTFNDIINANTSTLVGTPTLSSILVRDTFSSIGNVGIDTANIGGPGQSVLDNDTITGGETLSKFAPSQATLTGGGGTLANGTNTITTTNSGVVLLRADGTFTYNPAAGFTGADSFFYSVNGASGIATAQVTINVSTPIWFVKAGAPGTHDGTLANPFSDLNGGAGTFNSVNDAGAGHPKDNDSVFMYSGNYTGGLTLRNGQKLIGQGASATLASIAGVTPSTESNALPSTGGTNPIVTSSSNGINIGVSNSNTLRGFTIGNTTGAKIASGANFGTLTVGNNSSPDMVLSGSGQALNLTLGAFAATSGFNSVASTSSGTTGITLNGITGTVSMGSTTITTATTQGIFVTNTSADINFGNTLVGVGGSTGNEGIRLDTNTTGTRTFGTLTIANAGTFGFVGTGGSGGGNATINGAATITSVNSGVVMQGQANLTTINFTSGANVTTTGSGNAGILTSSSNIGTLTFSALTVQTNAGAGMNLSSGGVINVTSGTGTINNTTQAAPAIVANGVALNANFSSINSSGGTNGVSLTNVTGTSNFGNGALSGAASTEFLVSGLAGSVTYNGSITQTTAARVVDIQSKTGGTIALGGAITSNNGTGQGVFLNSNASTTINFTGGVFLSTGTVPAFTATTSGTISVTGATNTLATSTGTALNITSTTIGGSGVTFKSIAANGSTNGIVLSGTGAGAFTVTGDGASDPANTTRGNTTAKAGGGTISLGSGGTIQNTTGSGILLTNTGAVSLTSMNILNAGGASVNTGNEGIRATNVNGMTLDNVKVNGSTGNSGLRGYSSAGVASITNLAMQHVDIDGNGTVSGTETNDNWNVRIDELAGNCGDVTNGCGWNNSLFFNSRENIVGLKQGINFTTVSTTMTITNSEFRDTTTFASPANDAFSISANSTAVSNITATGSTFKNVEVTGFQYSGNDNSSGIMNVRNSIFENTGTDVNLAAGTGSPSLAKTLTFDVSGNTERQLAGNPLSTVAINIFLGGLSVAGDLMTGTVKNNTIGAVGVTSSGSHVGDGIDINATGAGTITATVSGNTVHQIHQGDCFFAEANSGSAKLNVFMHSNSFNTDTTTTALTGAHLVGGAQASDTANLCVDMGANTLHGDPTYAGAELDAFSTSATAIKLVGYGGANDNAGQISTFVVSSNTSVTPAPSIVIGAGSHIVSAANCGVSFPPIAPPADDTGRNRALDQRAGLLLAAAVTAPQLSPVANAQPAQSSVVMSSLSEATAVGSVSIDTPPLPVKTVKTEIAQATKPIAGKHNERGERSTASIEATKLDHPASNNAPVNHSVTANAAREAVANHSTRTKAVAADNPVTPSSGGTVTQSIGTLSAGSSVTIIFQVTINNAQPLPHTSISNQGNVTYTGGPGGGVFTDDPDTAAASDPTLTPLVQPTASNGTVSGTILDNNGNPVEGATVNLSGTQNRKFITDSNGHYSFDNVETNGFYTVTPSRANYLFSPAQRSFSQLGNNTDAAFNASLTGNALNPLDTPEYFVRQQYLDFLGREPDESGFNFWSDQILSCSGDAACIEGKRINTSAAFFFSIEFQQTGYLVYRMYQASYGDMPGAPVPLKLGEFRPDTAKISNGVIVNKSGWEALLESNKQAFATEFVQRNRFTTLYAGLNDAQFVDTLNHNAGFVLTPSERDQLVSDLETNAKTRAQALRSVAENSALAQQQFNQAFVLMQYFGYLRRDPNTGPDADFSGYDFWLNKLNTFGGNYQNAEMVKAFLVAGEYRGRFPK